MRWKSALLLACLALRVLSAQGTATRLKEQGLVDIRGLDPTIRVELKYASVDNFMGAAVYGDLRDCYLQKEVAAMLLEAQVQLRKDHPRLFLKVFDGARPRRVQERMWSLVKGTDQQNYVADPAVGSLHNYGAAVDLTLVDARDRELDMGTPFDHLGELAQPRHETRFLKVGRLTESQIRHRHWLRDAMVSAGFRPIPTEWWHFNAVSLKAARARYRLLE